MQKTTQARLLGYLALYGRAYPQAWSLAEEFRQDRSGLPDWPDWCYLPLGGWHAVIYTHIGGRELTMLHTADMASLAAMGAWRYTQGIYRYHPEIIAALSDTPVAGDMPIYVLYRMPEWCVYVEMPAEPGLCGFFAFLEYDANDGSHELRFVLDTGDGLVLGPIIHIGAWPVAHAMEILIREAREIDSAANIAADDLRKTTDLAGRLLSVVLYLCSDEPEISGHTPGRRPHYPAYKKTKRGLQLFPPDRPRVWRIGEEIGSAIERGRVSASGEERKGPRPHIRRAHWHGFWSGPIKPRPEFETQPERRFGYKWLPPTVVGIGERDGEE